LGVPAEIFGQHYTKVFFSGGLNDGLAFHSIIEIYWFAPTGDRHSVTLVNVEAHLPCFGPFQDCFKITLENFVVIRGINLAIQNAVVGKQSHL